MIGSLLHVLNVDFFCSVAIKFYFALAGMMHEASQLFSKMQEEGIKPGKVKLIICFLSFSRLNSIQLTILIGVSNLKA